MTKLEYMTKLQEKLEKFGKELQEEILEDYRQHFVEGESEGRSEEEIIEELGNIEEMIRELSEEDLPEGFTQLDAGKEPDREKDVEAGQDVRNTDLKKSFSYSAYYKGIVLDGKVANVIVNRSEDDKIHVDYEAKGISNQLNYEFFQHEEDGIFYAGVKRRKGGRDGKGKSRHKVFRQADLVWPYHYLLREHRRLRRRRAEHYIDGQNTEGSAEADGESRKRQYQCLQAGTGSLRRHQRKRQRSSGRDGGRQDESPLRKRQY